MTLARAIVNLVVVLSFVSGQSNISAQSAAPAPLVQTAVEPTSGTVGDKFVLSVTATAPDLEQLSALPLIDIDEQSTWTLLNQPTTTDASVGGGKSARRFQYIIVPFETGQIPLPQVAVTYTPSDGGSSNTVLSEPLIVSIDSVIAGSTAGTNLREVKRPVTLPLPKAVIWGGAILGFVILAFIGWLLWRRYSERIKKMLGGQLRPDEKALKELSQLELERLIEQKKLKEYYTRLADTVRHYLAAAYGVHAEDLTSNEMLRALDELAYEQPTIHSQNYKMAIAHLTELLDEADLVKFARVMPDAAHCRRALQHGRDVVSLTSYRFRSEEEEKADSLQSKPQPPTGPPPPSMSVSDVQASSFEGARR